MRNHIIAATILHVGFTVALALGVGKTLFDEWFRNYLNERAIRKTVKKVLE